MCCFNSLVTGHSNRVHQLSPPSLRPGWPSLLQPGARAWTSPRWDFLNVTVARFCGRFAKNIRFICTDLKMYAVLLLLFWCLPIKKTIIHTFFVFSSSSHFLCKFFYIKSQHSKKNHNFESLGGRACSLQGMLEDINICILLDSCPRWFESPK